MKYLKKYNELFINSTTVPPGHLINEPLSSNKVVDYTKQFLPKHKEEIEVENYDEVLDYFNNYKGDKLDEESIRAIIKQKWGLIPSNKLLSDIIIILNNSN